MPQLRLPHPFDFAQGRLFVVFEEWVITDLDSGLLVLAKKKVENAQARKSQWRQRSRFPPFENRTEPALSEVEGVGQPQVE